jgi:hypothetical protein
MDHRTEQAPCDIGKYLLDGLPVELIRACYAAANRRVFNIWMLLNS